uniref:Uncharacterized protein n=1 Tax=Alexandrium catenella TaxID=2925 RepID=A0A7S1LE00_ALECA
MPAEEAGTRVVLKDFPKGWCADGKELLLVSLQAQLQVFGALLGEPWIAPNLSHAEVIFKSQNDAKEAVEVLHGVDFREPEELTSSPDAKYKGLHVALKTGGKRGASTQHGEPAKKEARVAPGGLNVPPGDGALAALAGTWSLGYGDGSADLSYTITESGEVRVGKKRWLQLVPAGSFQDAKQDPNYTGTYFLNNAHREDTWEYIWLEGGVLQLHHFTTEDNGVSPYGSPNYWGCGTGQLADQVAGQGEMFNMQQQQQPPQQQWGGKKQKGWHKASHWGALAEFEGIWTVMYEGDPNMEAGMTYTITSSGEVTVGKKRHLQLVPAGSPADTRQDPNYAYEGIFLLDQCHREDTWEYMWIEFGRLCIHHFTEYDTGRGPFGSPHFWGMGMGLQAAMMAPQMMPAPRKGAPKGAPAWSPPAAWATQAASWGPAPAASYWRQGQVGKPGAKASKASWAASDGSGWGDGSGWAPAGAVAGAPPTTPVGPFEGTWSVEYEPGDGGMTYAITSGGEVKIGKKRRSQLVPAGSEWDMKKDPNYSGTYFLNEPHREDTWEYLWIENDVLQVHHFTGDDKGTSPLGSPSFFGGALGTRKETS